MGPPEGLGCWCQAVWGGHQLRGLGSWAPWCLVWDHNSHGKHVFIGKFTTTFAEMQKAFREGQVSWGAATGVGG